METIFINLNGGQIAYDDQGSGPLVVCVPGMGNLRADYRFLTPQLIKAGYRVITMDVRGHGESSTDWKDYSVAGVGADIVALIQTLASGPATIVGTSMAAGAAIVAAADAPVAVNGIVLIGPFVRDTMPGWQRSLLFSTLLAAPWGAGSWASYFTRFYPTQKPPDFDAYLAAVRVNMSDNKRLAALRAMMIASKAASEERLGKVNAPAMIIMGSKDPDFKDPQSAAHSVAASVHGAVTIVDGAGHYPHAEMPGQTAVAIIGFLQTIHGEAHVA